MRSYYDIKRNSYKQLSNGSQLFLTNTTVRYSLEQAK